jgi:hypothetical protein
MEATLKGCSEKDEWVTPEILLTNMSDCQIVGNKFQSFLSKEYHHSKWEEFRKMAKADSTNEECSQLLRRMELEDSDGEDVYMEDPNDKDVVEIVAAHFEEVQDRKKQKRQVQWGPIQRVARPRRYPEDGKMWQNRLKYHTYGALVFQ